MVSQIGVYTRVGTPSQPRGAGVASKGSWVEYRWWSLSTSGRLASFAMTYTLAMTNIAKERSTIFDGKIHFKWQSSTVMLNDQRVNG